MLSKQQSKSSWTELSQTGVNVHCVPSKTSATNLRENHTFSENCKIELKPLHINMQGNIPCEITYNIFKSYQRINILYPNYSFHHSYLELYNPILPSCIVIYSFFCSLFASTLYQILELSVTVGSFVQRGVHFPSMHSHPNDPGSNNFCYFTTICCQQLAGYIDRRRC